MAITDHEITEYARDHARIPFYWCGERQALYLGTLFCDFCGAPLVEGRPGYPPRPPMPPERDRMETINEDYLASQADQDFTHSPDFEYPPGWLIPYRTVTGKTAYRERDAGDPPYTPPCGCLADRQPETPKYDPDAENQPVIINLGGDAWA